MGTTRRSRNRATALETAGIPRAAAAGSPLLNLPIRHVMGTAHYVP
jgi:hypothetical protein